jgi:hypothetical protein
MIYFKLFFMLIQSVSPYLVILVHAMLRKRNFSNKVVNMLEKVKLSKTPMGTFLEAMRLHN